jgi:hypothetical protein
LLPDDDVTVDPVERGEAVPDEEERGVDDILLQEMGCLTNEQTVAEAVAVAVE